jgi:hypothetical protein
MAAGPTYEPIATVSISGTSTTTFSSIASTWTDLRLVFTGSLASSGRMAIQYNGDTGTNYSQTKLWGDGTSAQSTSSTNSNFIFLGATGTTNIRFDSFDIFSYAGSTYKTCLAAESIDGEVMRLVGLWRSTAAITSIKLYNFNGGNITGNATLYGIKAA